MSRSRKLTSSARRGAGKAFRWAGGATRSELKRLRSDLGGHLAELIGQVETLHERAAALERRQAGLGHDFAALKSLMAIEAVSRWVRHATLVGRPLVSVTLPTRNRPQRLARAIDSVLAGRYQNWELLVVDDGGREDSRAVVDAAGDPRVGWLGSPSGGVSAARNAGLKAASGEIVAYLDDDNMMDSDWLYAVAWAFGQRPDADVLYGALVIDDMLRVGRDASGALPWTTLYEWNREALREGNLADIGAIAHRSGLPGAWFDEGLYEMGDWDLLIRLTAEKDPLVLSAVACHYTTDAPDRPTRGPTHEADRATVTARAAAGSGS